uniref:RING-type domain-containing protein n=1 Tax=Oryza brachyantha TaxID=4533 RepID=J3LI16_ORYBR
MKLEHSMKVSIPSLMVVYQFYGSIALVLLNLYRYAELLAQDEGHESNVQFTFTVHKFTESFSKKNLALDSASTCLSSCVICHVDEWCWLMRLIQRVCHNDPLHLWKKKWEYEVTYFSAGLTGSFFSLAWKQRSGGCEEAAARARHGWTLDSNAREAKERLDQKLRAAAAVVKRPNSAGKLPQAGTSGGAGGGGDGEQPGSTTTTAAASAPQREVYTRKGGGWPRRRLRWFRLGWRAAAPEEEEEEECAVCLEELRAGEAVAHLPCAHRFHWGCAVPWVQAASRCPVCRAAVHLNLTGGN